MTRQRTGRSTVTWFSEPKLSYYERECRALEEYKRSLEAVQDPLLYTEGCAYVFKREAWLAGGYRAYLGTPVVGHILNDFCTLYIGRANLHHHLGKSKWANPFRMTFGRGAISREQAIEKYRIWIQTKPDLMASLGELQGHTLGCWCKPGNACHGDVLVELYTEWAEAQWRAYGFERVEGNIGVLGDKAHE